MRKARHTYFASIKKAKCKHWSTYLSALSPLSVWEAKKLALSRQPVRSSFFPDRDTPEGVNSALLSHFFQVPPPPALWNGALSPYPDHFPLSQEEMSRALANSSTTATSGPDSIPFSGWKRLHHSWL